MKPNRQSSISNIYEFYCRELIEIKDSFTRSAPMEKELKNMLADHVKQVGEIKIPSLGRIYYRKEGKRIDFPRKVVLDYLRNEHAAGAGLTIRKVGKAGIVDIKGLYKLFPGGPLKLSSKYAGIPKPTSCV